MRKSKSAGVNPETALLQYAFRLLARRDHGEVEIKKKLQYKARQIYGKTDEKIIGQVMARLKELGYLDDEKYTRHFLESKLSVSPQGKFALYSKLRQKGIPKQIFDKWWEMGKFDEQALAEKLLRQKRRLFARLPEEKKKQKIMSLLASRGFSPEVIYGLLHANFTI